MSTQISKLDKAKVNVMLEQPFFAYILCSRKLTADNSIKTLAVNARGDIFYNEKFVESLTVPQIVWGLCHEVGHVIGKHAMRIGNRDPQKWNYAADAWINDMLRDCGIGSAIPHTVDMPGSKDKTTETIYDELPDAPSNSKGKGTGTGEWDNGLGDDIIDEPMTESEKEELEAQVKIDIAKAAQAAKARGKLPGKLQEIVAGILNSKVPWYQVLERYMTSHIMQNYTWTKPNRRFIGNGTYLPSMAKEPTMGEVVIQVDVSGSISNKELEHYQGHLSSIVAQCKPSKVHVIYTDTEVQKHTQFECGEEIKLEFMRGGGTRMEAGFEYLAEQGIEPQVCVTLTDGYDRYEKEPDFQTVWCVSSDVVPPYGECIHFELEEAA